MNTVLCKIITVIHRIRWECLPGVLGEQMNMIIYMYFKRIRDILGINLKEQGRTLQLKGTLTKDFREQKWGEKMKISISKGACYLPLLLLGNPQGWMKTVYLQPCGFWSPTLRCL